MPSQSGKIVLVLSLLILVLGAAAYFFLRDSTSLLIREGIGVGTLSSENNNHMQAELSPLKNLGGRLEGIDILAQFPENSELEEFSASDFGVIKNSPADKAYKFYFNENSQIDGVDKEYSGLTLFFISFQNKDRLPTKEFLPTITKDETNTVNTLEDVKIGSFEGFKHIQCCSSGGVTEYYFLNQDLSKLILIKAYNYGPDRDLYDKELEAIVRSIEPISE